MEGWRVASKRLGPLPRRRGSALARGCGRGGRGALPLARAAAVSTGLRVRAPQQAGEDVRRRQAVDAPQGLARERRRYVALVQWCTWLGLG